MDRPEGSDRTPPTAQASDEVRVEQVLDVWSRVLGAGNLTAADNFFRLGGKSLQAAQAALLLQRATSRPVGLAAMLEHRDATHLAQIIGRLEPSPPVSATDVGTAPHLPVNLFQPEPRGAHTPPPNLRSDGPQGEVEKGSVSCDQERRLLRDRRYGTASDWRLDFGFEISGPVDVERLSRAVDGLLARHEVLRSRFYFDSSGQPHQEVMALRPGALSQTDLRNVESDHAESDVAQSFLAEPFDRAAGQVFRALLVRHTENLWHLLFSVDHLVCDLRSKEILLRDLSSFYGFPDAVGMADPVIPFRAFAAWQRTLSASPSGAALRRFWSDYLGSSLSDSPPVVTALSAATRGADALPDLPEHGGGRSAWFHSRLPAPPGGEPVGRVREGNRTPALVGLGALYLVLAALTGTRDHVVATPAANRENDDFSGTVGWLSSLIAVRATWSAGITVHEFLQTTTSAYVAALRHSQLSWSEIIRTCNPTGYASNPRSPEVYFDVLGSGPSETFRLGEASCRPLPPAGGYGGYPAFNMLVTLAEDGWQLSASVNEDLFSRSAAEHLLQGYSLALGWLLDPHDHWIDDRQRELARVLQGP
ncbi:hypothetical protein GCM10022225_07470 [Plantactinospora mayteni]|uniref:Carrier domain-containing protein n=2 Tax=Plantactinospora mayteni TaxID=566021 RepID=A0ABQ4EIF3_9ACTN|nr:hypothetical protein Pma05_10790 [Plantactinospora mayteni]